MRAERAAAGKRTSCGCVRGEGLEDGRDATVCLNRASGAAKMNLVAEATVAPSGARAASAYHKKNKKLIPKARRRALRA